MNLRIGLGRFLVTLALIVQILAPVGANAAVMRLAFDPLVDIIVCAQDQDVVDNRLDIDPAILHHGDACGLCQLVAAGGYAPPVLIPSLVEPASSVARFADWRISVERIVGPRLLEHIRGRAPPFVS